LITQHDVDALPEGHRKSEMNNTIVVIPARMQATRLPGKPMADIHGEPMIVHVWRRAMAAETGRVVVATDSEEIAAAVRAAGGEAVMTRAEHISGSDRVFEAVSRVDPDCDLDIIVNVQGDLPTLEPRLIQECVKPLADLGVHSATIAAEITVDEERTAPNVVKVVGTPVFAAAANPNDHPRRLRAGRTRDANVTLEAPEDPTDL
jgi:3-deoxy-manno-octulosonate cytidylyltransferase (CMP-KDO synthetase)